MNKLILVFWVMYFCISCKNEQSPIIEKEGTKWAFPDSLDAVKVAPKSHEVLLENERVRVLLVKIKPGEKEPMHTHSWESVMMVDQPSRIRYYDKNNKIRYESPKENFNYAPAAPNWMEAEGVHAIENIDTIDFIARRVELKEQK